jgi:AraC-like DNA-binding protein
LQPNKQNKQGGVEPQKENKLLLTDRNLLNQHGLLMATVESDSPLLSVVDYHIPNVLVILCEQGKASFEYDFTPLDICRCDIFIGLPGHIIRMREVSDDYRIRVISISEDFCIKARNLNLALYLDTYGYNAEDSLGHLTDNQYAQICDAFNMLQTVSAVGKKWREDMMLNSFLTIVMLHHEFCSDKIDSKRKPAPSLSVRFQEAVVKHFRESSDVDFYANMFGLSPKYFSILVKAEMGVTPRKWIMRYIALQAKSILVKRPELNIQQVAYLMGFSNQSAFTRFFKKHVGVTPKEYRNSPKPDK